MAPAGSWRVGRFHVATLLTTLGTACLLAGGTLVTTGLASVSGAATTTLSFSTTAAGVTCNNANPSDPICSGLAGGDVLNVTGTGFAPGAEASIEQCNSDPAQPVILFLGNDVPVSCSPIKITTIGSTKKTKGDLSGPITLTAGTVGPPVNGQTPTCTQISPTTSVITNCSTSGSGATDAALYPCPPTDAQQAAGDTCVVAIGDINGDRAIGTILFGSETLPTSTTTPSSTSSTTSTTSTSTTSTTTPTTTTSTTSTTTTSTTSTTSTTTPTTTTSTTPTSTTSTTTPTTSFTTTQVSATSVTLGSSGSVSDNVTVQGNATYGAPVGSVAFYVCQTGTSQTLDPGACPVTVGDHLSSTRVAPGAGDASTASSSTFDPTSAGTWCFSALFTTSGSYDSSADNTGANNLDPGECLLVGSAASSAESFVSSASVTLGPAGTINDFVEVDGTTVAGPPTGDVAFYVCQIATSQTFTPGTCPSTGTPEDPAEALVGGAGVASSATSNTFTPTSAGTWCYSAVYGGDDNYLSSADNTDVSNADPDECVLVTTAPSTTASTVSSADVTLGPTGTITDAVSVTGNGAGGSPTGDVAFYLCQTGTSSQTLMTGSCAATGTPEDPGESLVGAAADASSATSAPATPTAAGTWCFSAVYGGDDNYQSSADNVDAGSLDPNECVLVAVAPASIAGVASPATVVLGSGSITDAATVTGNAVGGAPTGTVDFYLCGPVAADAVCSSTSTAEGTPTLLPSGSDTSSATSGAFTPSAAGYYCFADVYAPASGSNYGASSDNVSGTTDTSDCTRVVAPYSFTSAASAAAAKGGSFTFDITTSETGPVVIKKKGALPKGLKFIDDHNGSATISGIPKKAGTFPVTFTATFGTGKAKHIATQGFTLTVVTF